MSITRQISRKGLLLQNTDAEVATMQTLTPYYDWRINGELTVPIEAEFDGARFVDAGFNMYRATISAKVGADTIYQVKIISVDAITGLDPIEHVNTTVTLVSNQMINLLIDDAEVEDGRLLKISVVEDTVGATKAQDVIISIIGEDFSELSPKRDGHIIEDIDENTLPQTEKLQIVGAILVDDPGLRTTVNIGQLGDIKHSILELAPFQSLHGTGWVLMDGSDITGSALAALTGKTKLPDARGASLKMKIDIAPIEFVPADVNAGADTITLVGHPYRTGMKAEFSTTGTIPGGLFTRTQNGPVITSIINQYYIIVINDNTIKVATTFANAIAGTAVDITAAGAGTHTIYQGHDVGDRYDQHTGALSNDTGSWQDDSIRRHSHDYASDSSSNWSGGGNVANFVQSPTSQTSYTGSRQTTTQNVSCNMFIKIN